MARRRRAGGASVSFFAFQDIITAVSGIMVLLVLFLILMLEKPGFREVPVEVPNDLTLEDLEDLITRATEKIREFEMMKIESAGASGSALQAEIANLREGLAESESTGMEQWMNKLQAAQQELEEVQKRASEITAERDRLAVMVDEIRGRVDARADGLADDENSSQIWLDPGETKRTPVIVEIDGKGAVLREFADPEQEQRISEAQFSAILSSADEETSYFVFFLRPDGIDRFRGFLDRAQKEGFAVGYQALDRGTEIKLLGPDGPGPDGPGQKQ